MAQKYPYTKKQRSNVLDVAMSAVEARIEGRSTYTRGGQVFKLNEPGMCARFVRQVFEVGVGLGEGDWPFASGSAKEMIAKLAEAGYEVNPEALRPGDILGHTNGKYGHVAVYVGMYYGEKDGRLLVAENTSWTGGMPEKPGTKITRLGVFLERSKGWRAFRLFAA